MMRAPACLEGSASRALSLLALALGLASAPQASASPILVQFTAEVVSTIELFPPDSGIGPAPIDVGSVISGEFRYDPAAPEIGPGAFVMSSMQLQFSPSGVFLDATFRSSSLGDSSRSLTYVGYQLTSRSSVWRADAVAVVFRLADSSQPGFPALPSELSLDEFGAYPESYLLIDGLACSTYLPCPDIADDGWQAFAMFTSLTTTPVPEPSTAFLLGALLIGRLLGARRLR